MATRVADQAPVQQASTWTIDDSRSLYNVEGWGIGFFDVNERFRSAIREFGYEGGYTLVYPIKVNQQRHVIEEIVQYGAPYGVGLECGSKPELQAGLALSESTDHMIVCNGYKDEEFMRLALMGQKLGHQVFVVIEQLAEVETLLRVAEELGVTPT